MTKILLEFYVKEARIKLLYVPNDSASKLFQYYRKRYVAQNNISDSILDLSYQYYLENPVEMTEIYNRLIDSLSIAQHKTGSGARQ